MCAPPPAAGTLRVCRTLSRPPPTNWRRAIWLTCPAPRQTARRLRSATALEQFKEPGARALLGPDDADRQRPQHS